jgi:hypothetical protein
MERRYVNVYEVEEAYGGPEEGGWWYDIGTPLASYATTCICESDNHIEHCPTRQHLDKVEREYIDGNEEGRYTDGFIKGWEDSDDDNIGRGEIATSGKRIVWVEDEPAQYFPTERPHYE